MCCLLHKIEDEEKGEFICGVCYAHCMVQIKIVEELTVCEIATGSVHIIKSGFSLMH